MLAAALLAATLADCVPMRWISANPASLDLLAQTPISCLLLEESQWSPDLLSAARNRGLRTIAIARKPDQAQRAAKLDMDALVTENAFAVSTNKPVIILGTRQQIQFDSPSLVIGTTQGVWPGTEVEHGGPKSTTNAAPTGGIWIHTNTGFLRYARTASKAAFWMANLPATEVSTLRYGQAIADAAANAAHWVLALDSKLQRRLLDRDPAALKDWQQINTYLRFYEDHKEWRAFRPFSEVALVQDGASGALVTGNLLDMLAVMNTPVKPVQPRELTASQLDGTRLTIAIHPQAYTPEQQALITRFSEQGGKLVSGPKDWKMPEPSDGQFTFDKRQYKQLEAIWPELHLAVQRKNFGVRMFNVTGTLTYLQRSPDGKQVALHLVNYTDYPVESITAFVQGKYKRARLITPENAPRELTVYDAPEGTGVEIEKLGLCGVIILE